MNMRRTLSIILLLAVLAVGCYSYSSGDTRESSAINAALQAGEVGILGGYFDESVDLGLGYKSMRCSKSDAAGLMEEFFRQNKPCNYVCDTHRNHVSGSLTTAEGKQYRVDYTLKTINNQRLITGLYVY